MAEPASPLDQAYAHCAELVRTQDRDRFLSALFAPQDKRRHLLALYAFNIEVSRVREVVREPLPGEVRLAWWREAIEGQGRGDVAAHPVAYALIDTMERFRLPTMRLSTLADARIFDLYDDPMPTLTDLEGYAGETASTLMQMALFVLTPDHAMAAAEACGHGGVAQALTGLMRAFPLHSARGQCFLPLDLLQRHGVDREAAVSGTPTAGLIGTLTMLRAEAGRHLRLAAEALAQCPALSPDGAPAFLPLALVSGDLAALARVNDPFREVAGLPAMRRQFRLWRAARRSARSPRWLDAFVK